MSDKVVDKDNQLWFTESNGTTNIGFTADFLTRMDECWHILPSHNKKAKQNASLLCIETNDGLLSLDSPCTGDIVFFNEKARDFPDKLMENDIIVVVGVNKKEASFEEDEAPPQPRARNIPRLDPMAAPSFFDLPTAPRMVDFNPPLRVNIPTDIREEMERQELEQRTVNAIRQQMASMAVPRNAPVRPTQTNNRSRRP